MESEFSEKLEIWKKHVTDAESDPSGIGNYCREHGIKSSVYYSWRQVIKHEFSGDEMVFPREPKKLKPSFIPVVIEEPAIVAPPENEREFLNLPDARWVAEVMLHLMRGLP